MAGNIGNHKLVQLDTNALSNTVKKGKSILEGILNKYPVEEFVICYSPHSLIELKRSELLFKNYCEGYSFIPSFLLKGIDQIRDFEIRHYGSKTFDPVLLSPLDFRARGKIYPKPKELAKIFTKKVVRKAFGFWEKRQDSILRGMLGLIANYPPKGSKYSKKEIDKFIRMATYDQIILYDKSFIHKIRDYPDLNLEAVPSFALQSAMVFNKFYVDNRKPQQSDVYDIVIASSFPYVDAVITEGNMFQILKQLKQSGRIKSTLEIQKVSEF